MLHALASHATPSATAIVTTLQSLPKTSFYGQPVVLAAKVTGATGGTVEFFDGTTELAGVNLSTRGSATFVTDTLGLGSHSLTAEYFLSSNTAQTIPDSTSAVVTETVDAAPTHTVVVASSDPGVAGADVSFTAIVGSWTSIVPTGSNDPPAGTVSFTVTSTAGGTPVTGSVTLDSAGAATFTPTTPLDAGTYSVVAAFTPSDSNYAASTSRTLTEKIVAASAVGTGAVTVGTSTAPVTLRNGAQLYVNITQGLDTTTGMLTESSDSTVTYVEQCAAESTLRALQLPRWCSVPAAIWLRSVESAQTGPATRRSTSRCLSTRAVTGGSRGPAWRSRSTAPESIIIRPKA